MNRKLLIYLLATALLIIALRWQGATLVTPLAPRGILDLEFARTPQNFQRIALFWNSEDVVDNILLDFAFIIAYTGLFLEALKAFAFSFTHLLRKAAIAAGLLDFTENILMLLVVNGRIPATALQPVFYIALLKFVLVGVVLLAILLLTLYTIVRLPRWRKDAKGY